MTHLKASLEASTSYPHAYSMRPEQILPEKNENIQAFHIEDETSINQSINQSNNQTIKQSINQSNNQSINQSINQTQFLLNSNATLCGNSIRFKASDPKYNQRDPPQ